MGKSRRPQNGRRRTGETDDEPTLRGTGERCFYPAKNGRVPPVAAGIRRRGHTASKSDARQTPCTWLKTLAEYEPCCISGPLQPYALCVYRVTAQYSSDCPLNCASTFSRPLITSFFPGDPHEHTRSLCQPPHSWQLGPTAQRSARRGRTSRRKRQQICAQYPAVTGMPGLLQLPSARQGKTMCDQG
jgi:hypothetical protein